MRCRVDSRALKLHKVDGAWHDGRALCEARRRVIAIAAALNLLLDSGRAPVAALRITYFLGEPTRGLFSEKRFGVTPVHLRARQFA